MFEISQMSGELAKRCKIPELFDLYRLVNPQKHDVYNMNESGHLEKYSEKCFEIWGKNCPCPNCISRRACLSRKGFIKLEYLDGKSLLVFAQPMAFNGTMFSLELIRDVTSSMLITNGVMHDNSDITSVINQFNILATTEALTGLYNRSYIENEIETHIKYRKDYSICVVMLDLDNFKSINDNYGHASGDEVLLRVAELFKATERECGCKAARYGGDEFVLVFEDGDTNTISRIIDVLRGTLEAIEFKTDKGIFHASFSYGIALSEAEDSAISVIERADKQMYEMKNKYKDKKH